MSEKEPEKQTPSHRVSFARINGQDREGNDILGPAREVGSIWPRRGKEGEGILRFDHIPEEMRGRNGGVLFIKELDEARGQVKPAAQSRNRDDDRGR